MEYKKTTWVDHKTPVDAKRLNNIENAIDTLSKTSITPGKLKTINGKSIIGPGNIDIAESLGYTPASVEEVPVWTDVEPDGSETTEVPSIRLGTGLITSNGETATGRWNKSIPGNIFEVGSGSGPEDRRNSLEINSNGDVYLMGIGGYDGTNSTDPNVLPVTAGIPENPNPETQEDSEDQSSEDSTSHKVWVGTIAEYRALGSVSEDTVYYIKKS